MERSEHKLLCELTPAGCFVRSSGGDFLVRGLSSVVRSLFYNI